MTIQTRPETVQELYDKLQIQETINRYSEGLGRRDWAQVASAFASDATWEVVGMPLKYSGDCAAGIRTQVDPSNFLVQMISNTLIQVNGDRATARSTAREVAEFEAGKFREFKAAIDVFGTYEDELKRIDGHWKFAARRFVPINFKVTHID
jgi:hypothetical protein